MLIRRSANPFATTTQERAGFRASGLATFLLIAAGMGALLSLYYLIQHRAFAFVDIGSDTFFQFYPLQVAEIRQLRALHELTWSFNIGLGAYIGSDFDPIQLLAVLFPDSWQLGIRLPLYLCKLLLAGAFFQTFLRRAGFERRISVIGGLGYAFCSFAMVNAQWGENGFALVQFAAMLCFLEGYVRDRGAWNGIAAGITVGLGEAFDVYTLGLFSVLYLAARLPLLALRGWRPLAARLAALAGLALLGFLLLAPIQFPNLHYLFDSPRVSGGHSIQALVLNQIFHLNDPVTIGSELAGFFGKDLLGTANQYRGWDNYFEGPGFYVGLLPLICIPQLIGQYASRRERWYAACGTGLLVAYLVWPALRYAVYGFGHLAFRLSTLWISIGLLVLGMAGLRRMSKSGVWLPGIWIALAGILCVLALLALRVGTAIKVPHLAMVAAFAVTYAVLLPAFFRVSEVQQGRSLSLLLPIVALELLLFAVPPMMDRSAVGLDGSSAAGRYDDGTPQALAWIQAKEGDTDFYRIEKTYNSVFLCDALVQDYAGVKSYFFHGSSLTRFVDRMQLHRPLDFVNYIGSAVERPEVLDLLGVRYLLTRNRDLDGAPGLHYVGSAKGIDIYRNDHAHTFAWLYHDVISEAEANAMSLQERDARMLHTAVVEDPASVNAALMRLDDASHADATEFASLRKGSDVYLQGTVDAAHAGLLLLSMPYDGGWSARMDDASVTLMRADYGLTALPVAPGLHQLTLRYTPPGRKLGSLGTSVSLFILGLLALRRRLMARAQRAHKAKWSTANPEP